MHQDAPDRAQRAYARVAGIMYLLNYATAVFGTLAPASIRGGGDFAERAGRVLSSELLYRTALTSMAFSWLLIVPLAFGLYVALEPVSKRLAQLALCFELGESFIGAVTVMGSVAAVGLYTATQTSAPFAPEQLQTLVAVIGSASGRGFDVAMAFLGVGSTLFFYLFHRSRYVPRPLAAFGVFASALLLVVSLAALAFPAHAGTLRYGWGPMGLAELGTGLWLSIVGLRPAPGSAPAAARA